MDALNEFEGTWNGSDLGRGAPEQVALESAVLFQLCICERPKKVNENLFTFSPVHDKVQFSLGNLFPERAQEFPPCKTVGRMAVHNDAIHVEHYSLQPCAGLRVD